MKLRVLKYILTVAWEENMTRAAEMLRLSQLAISWQMALYEFVRFLTYEVFGVLYDQLQVILRFDLV